MRDLATHLGLFALVALAIVALGAMYAEAEDRPALRGFPRRFLYFVGGCALLTAIVLAIEHTVASVR